MNLTDPSLAFSPAWLWEMFGPRDEFSGFTDAELQEIGRLSEAHLLKEAVRLVLLARKETT
jgi:hypothetical protein